MGSIDWLVPTRFQLCPDRRTWRTVDASRIFVDSVRPTSSWKQDDVPPEVRRLSISASHAYLDVDVYTNVHLFLGL